MRIFFKMITIQNKIKNKNTIEDFLDLYAYIYINLKLKNASAKCSLLLFIQIFHVLNKTGAQLI